MADFVGSLPADHGAGVQLVPYSVSARLIRCSYCNTIDLSYTGNRECPGPNTTECYGVNICAVILSTYNSYMYSAYF